MFSKENILEPTLWLKRSVFLAVFLSISFFYLQLTSSNWVITPDSTDYVEGARSLAQFKGYMDAQGRPLTFYPPGTSLVYALAALMPGNDYYSYNLMTKIFILGFLALSYLLIKSRYGIWPALGGFLLLSFSIIPMYESIRILSDLVFAFCFVVTIFLFPPERLESMGSKEVVALGCLLVCCYYLRAPGVFVFCGYFFYILFQVRTNKFKTIFLLSVIVISILLPLLLRNARIGSGYSYLQLMFLKKTWLLDSGTVGIGDWGERILENIRTIYGFISIAFSNQYGKSIHAAAIACLAVGGIVMSLKNKSMTFYSIMIFLYVVELTITQTRDLLEARYIIPLMPLLIIFSLHMVVLLLDRLNSVKFKYLVILAVTLFFIINPFWKEGFLFGQGLRKSIDKTYENHIVYLGHENFVGLVKKYRDLLSKNDVVVTMHANIVRYFVPQNTKVMNFLLTKDADRAFSSLMLQKAKYLFIDKKKLSGRPGVQLMIDKYQNHFALFEENKDAAIYKVMQVSPEKI